MTLAALEQVLRIYRFHADELAQRLPTLRLLTLPQETIRASARRLLPAVQAAIERVWPACYRVSAADCLGQVGSGALPVDTLPSHGLRIETTAPKRERREALVVLEGVLRSLPRPVIARLERDALVLDLRCLDDEGGFVSQLAALAPPG
jgi:L-seryl-tRNA(Ser) seleniumtransferase